MDYHHKYLKYKAKYLRKRYEVQDGGDYDPHEELRMVMRNMSYDEFSMVVRYTVDKFLESHGYEPKYGDDISQVRVQNGGCWPLIFQALSTVLVGMFQRKAISKVAMSSKKTKSKSYKPYSPTSSPKSSKKSKSSMLGNLTALTTALPFVGQSKPQKKPVSSKSLKQPAIKQVEVPKPLEQPVIASTHTGQTAVVSTPSEQQTVASTPSEQPVVATNQEGGINIASIENDFKQALHKLDYSDFSELLDYMARTYNETHR